MASDKDPNFDRLNEEDHLLKLLRDSKTRDKGFRQLMHRYQEKVYWHVRRIVHDHDDSNDIVQDTFMKAYRAIDRFKGDAKIYTWLYRIASNEAITWLKRKKRRVTHSIDNEDSVIAQRLEADPYFDGDHTQKLLYMAIASLPDKQQLVFNMRYFDELPYREISRILKTSEGALKASFHHAVRKIEKFFQDVEV